MDSVWFWMAKSLAEMLVVLLFILVSLLIFTIYSVIQVRRNRERIRRENKNCPNHSWVFLTAYGSDRRCTRCGVWRNYEDR